MKKSSKSTASNGLSNGHPAKKQASNGKNGGSALPSRFYGSPLPGIKPEELSGSLIVVEGTDGSGRSTQISCLRNGSSRKASPLKQWAPPLRSWWAKISTLSSPKIPSPG